VSRREAWLSVIAVAAVALVARVLASQPIAFPRPEDTAYYVGVARNLLEGRGLVSDAIWSFQTPPLEFPRPAFEVWLPLPTFLAAIPMALLGQGSADLGPASRAAQVMSIAAGTLVAVLAWRLGADVAAERGLPTGRARVLALGSGFTAAVYLPLLLHSALPDSTMVFAAIVLGACLLMTRLLRDPRGARLVDPRLLALGALLGLGALTRNEAIWLALVWAGLVVAARGLGRDARLRLIGGAALVAIVVFVPWAIRDLAVFGSLLPGQALSNALSVSGTDIFAWSDPPTLSRYLAQGPVALLEARVDGLAHNLLNVLVYLGVPLSIVGLLALPWTARGAALRPLLAFGIATFLITSLVFPIATQWGTFLHGGGALHVLLIVSALAALDAGIAWVGVRRGWTRPVAWLGATLAIAGSVLFSVVVLPTFGAGSDAMARRYAAIGEAMAAAGMPFDEIGPVITDYPIWLAEAERTEALALPDEPPSSVLSLAAAFPGTKTVLTFGGLHQVWFDSLAAGAPGSECFEEVRLPVPVDPRDAEAIADARAWRIACP
jgi:hypothetical protein